MQERSLLVQVLLDMATGGGAKLVPLVVDKAGVFDAGLNKGYNPVTVASGDTSVLAEKGAVANHAVVVTPEARIIAGWQDGKSVTGEGIGVSASELVSGTYSVSQAGSADVTNYQNVNVKSGGTTASVDKTTVDPHTVRFTPKASITQGWQDSGTVSGESVDVNAGELVSGTYPVGASGEFDVSAYEKISVPSGVVAASATKGIVAGHTVTVTPKASRTAGFINSGETEGLGVNVTASELVSGTLNVSQSGTQDVTNYKNISVPNGEHSASATKGAVSNHSISITPKSTATAGFVGAGTVNGASVSVSANELVSGRLSITSNGIIDVTNYKEVEVSGIVIKDSFGSISGTVTTASSSVALNAFPNPNNLNVTDYDAFLFTFTLTTSSSNSPSVIIAFTQLGQPNFAGDYLNICGGTFVNLPANTPVTIRSLVSATSFYAQENFLGAGIAINNSTLIAAQKLTNLTPYISNVGEYSGRTFTYSGSMYGLKF